MKRKERAKQIQSQIRRVLLKQWDPIGVSDVSKAQDEYDGYVGEIYQMLSQGVTEAALVGHLWRIEKENIGLSCDDQEKLAPVARALLALDVKL